MNYWIVLKRVIAGDIITTVIFLSLMIILSPPRTIYTQIKL